MTDEGTIKFRANGINCVASKLDNSHYMLNMGSCLINLDGKPAVNVDYLPTGIPRVTIKHGQVWFDVENSETAPQIEYLFTK